MLILFAVVTWVSARSQSNSSAADKLIGVNLVSNPGAEKLVGDKPDHWILHMTENSQSISAYGATAGEWDYNCTEKCGLPKNAGQYYFRAAANLEEGETAKSLEQTIDISGLKDTLAVRAIRFSFGVQAAGLHCDTKQTCAFAYLRVAFVNAAGQVLITFDERKLMSEFHRVDESEGADSRMHKFVPFAIANVIPNTSVKAVVTIGAEQNCGTEICSDAYAFFDNVSLVLSKAGKR